MEFSFPFIDQLIEELRSNNERLEAIIARLEAEDDNILLSCTEAARHLCVSNTSISKMLTDGRLHRVTRGRSNGIPLSEVKKVAGMRLERKRS